MRKEKKEHKEGTNPTLPIIEDGKIPHRCPVCRGNGLVPNGFYVQTLGCWTINSITPETCRSCNGTGIVWA